MPRGAILNCMVWKAITVALVVVFACETVSPTLFPVAGSTLPACCRRDGHHHCLSQSGMTPSGTAEGSVWNTVRCPSFPQNATAAGGRYWVPPPSPQAAAAVFSHPAAKAQTEAYCRISLIRGSQKRGPPALA
jgi:hypothetical protein